MHWRVWVKFSKFEKITFVSSFLTTGDKNSVLKLALKPVNTEDID